MILRGLVNNLLAVFGTIIIICFANRLFIAVIIPVGILFYILQVQWSDIQPLFMHSEFHHEFWDLKRKAEKIANNNDMRLNKIGVHKTLLYILIICDLK